MSINVDPLTDDEFEELDAFLLSLQCAEDAMTMDVLHGFLTAIVIGPEPVPLSEWLPHVWGSPSSQSPQFQSPEQQERITDLILRFMNEIAVTFDVAPKEFEPLFCEQEWNGRMLTDAEGWAMGFWESVNLRPTAWKPIWSSDMAILMKPLYLLGADDIDEDEVQLVSDPMKAHKLALQIESNILPIRRFWREHQQSGKLQKKSERPDVTGAEPCPCGSGKKFKQCCGNEPTLH
ncbi:MAG: YecA family protein [Oxalobacter sp.]|nr:MAG: YecA family protein [Oxalobacter sp.]